MKDDQYDEDARVFLGFLGRLDGFDEQAEQLAHKMREIAARLKEELANSVTAETWRAGKSDFDHLKGKFDEQTAVIIMHFGKPVYCSQEMSEAWETLRNHDVALQESLRLITERAEENERKLAMLDFLTEATKISTPWAILMEENEQLKKRLAQIHAQPNYPEQIQMIAEALVGGNTNASFEEILELAKAMKART